jgi:hypothetical protein
MALTPKPEEEIVDELVRLAGGRTDRILLYGSLCGLALLMEVPAQRLLEKLKNIPEQSIELPGVH